MALVRFEHGEREFEVLGSTGRVVLAKGVRLPTSVSALVLKASEGQRAYLPLEHSSRPLDRLLASLGFGSGASVPLQLAGRALGAVVALWNPERDAPPIPELGSITDESDLLQVLLAPRSHAPRVLVCHEAPLVAGGLARLAEQELAAVATVASSRATALDRLSTDRPELIVCSERFSAGQRLAELAEDLRAAGSAAPLLVVAQSDSRHSFDAAVRAGAAGFLTLARANSDFATTAGALLAGTSVLDASPRTARPNVRLTDREHDVLACFDCGLSDKEIARKLGVAVSTVKTHARGLYGKLGVTSRTAALHRAREEGLI